MVTVDRAGTSDQKVTRLLPKVSSTSKPQLAVAGLVLGSLGVLYAFRRGFKGIGELQLSGSAVRGVEFAAYLMIVGATVRTLQTHYPDSAFSKAVNFIY